MSLLEFIERDRRGWARVGDLYEVTRKPRGLDLSSLETIPFTPMDAIPHGGVYASSYISKAPNAITSGTYFERGDVLVAKITPSFENGKQAMTTDLPAPFGYATTEVIPLRPRASGQDRRLLFFYLLHPDIRNFVAERMEGTTGRQRVPENVLLDLAFPAIEPVEQTAIADVLELIQRASMTEALCEEKARDLKRAAMRALFTRGLRGEPQKETEIGPVPERWEVVPLGRHFSAVSGGTPSRDNPNFWQGGTIPWVKTTEVNYGVIDSTEEHITEAGLNGCSAKWLSAGTLLMAMYGQGVTRGKVAILGIGATCNQACAALKPLDESVSSVFLFYFLSWRYEEIRQLAHGGQQQNLNLDIVRELPIIRLADLDEQREIVTILDAIDQKIELHKRKRAVLDALFKSLLHKLMTGEIRVRDLDLSALDSPEAAEVTA